LEDGANLSRGALSVLLGAQLQGPVLFVREVAHGDRSQGRVLAGFAELKQMKRLNSESSAYRRGISLNVYYTKCKAGSAK
jgi:hypothetical protein